MSSSEIVQEQLQTLDIKLGQLKREYDEYFLGTRPREPRLLRGEVQKLVVVLTSRPFQNTALKFRFGSLCSRYQAMRRQWDETLRKIEDGSYERHRFKAGLRAGASQASAAAAAPRAQEEDVVQSYLDARMACGQSVSGMTRKKVSEVIERQRAQLSKRFGDGASFQFHVAVEDGQVKLKASRVS